MRRFLLPLLILIPVAAGVAFGVKAWNARRTHAALVRTARDALDLGEYPLAERLARQALEREPESSEVLLIAGEASLGAGDFGTAAGFFRRLPDGESRAVRAYLSAARLALEQAHLSEAERHLRDALELDPGRIDANRQLANLLNAEGRRREAAPYQLELIKQAQFSIEELLLLSNVEEPYYDLPLLERAVAAVPDDPVPSIGQAHAAMLENRPADAVELLRRVVEKTPSQLEAQALLGRTLLDLDATDEWLRWHQALPTAADEHPDVWYVRGTWAEARDQQREAARCFWEAVRRDPDHRRANYQLGRLLTALGRPDDAAPFLERARRLTKLHDLLHPIFLDGPVTTSMLSAADVLEGLGRLWEAWAWCFAVTALEPENATALAERKRLRDLLRRDRPPRTLAEANPATQLDLSGYPLPDWSVSPGRTRDGSKPSSAQPVFEDVAAAVGIDFQYYNSGDPERIGKRMFETTGGGVAAFDLDADGRPDLHFTQGCRWPPDPGQTEHLDRCFRNLGDRFADVTAKAGLGDARYGQGVAAGDVDNDGFADLYVANIRGNRLYRNNGDGTFTDVAEGAGVAGDRWTTSCVIADLTGDGFPDLYDVNYLRGDDIFERLCGAHILRACAPSGFDGAADQVNQNLGDGSWADVSSTAGLGGLLGKGLGVVAGDFDGSGRLSLFVGNDGEANFFLANRTEPNGGLRFAEEALLAGCAFDRDGVAMASMGIAADDADGDGRLDLFVTAYYDDSNTLYLQQPGTLFLDRTREAGLHDPSWHMLGFGTQFLDGDLDGAPDLVVTNGHIDDFTHEGIPYKMRPQYYRNLGRGTFEELSSESLGPWFAGEYLGRGLATLDWNRDGLEDFVVSHLDVPAALVTNRTANAGRSVAVRLVGVETARDAIGTTVTAKVGDLVRVRQLTAGDGYQASNERRLVFGLGASEQVDELTVRWPSGATQTFAELPAGAQYLLIEGRDRPLVVPSGAAGT